MLPVLAVSKKWVFVLVAAAKHTERTKKSRKILQGTGRGPLGWFGATNMAIPCGAITNSNRARGDANDCNTPAWIFGCSTISECQTMLKVHGRFALRCPFHSI
mmetsp:Transcript_30995/g.71426  ORF Transcript_30995/g.71426 Transcript_30995/m.71426 type:complete len:103 (-) Transcript_30995:744-1052(-)